jgi:hypothetical protein
MKERSNGMKVCDMRNKSRVLKKLISCILCISWLTMSAVGATGVSPEFKMDIIRLRGGTLSADRIKADYDMIVNRNFLRYGPVENGKGATE